MKREVVRKGEKAEWVGLELEYVLYCLIYKTVLGMGAMVARMMDLSHLVVGEF